MFPDRLDLRPFDGIPRLEGRRLTMTKEYAQDEVRQAVRDVYAKAAGGCAVPGCCGLNPTASLRLGYTAEDVASVPEGANLGLGCGNPQAIAALCAPARQCSTLEAARGSTASWRPSRWARAGVSWGWT
jgi:hypothetical protein